MISLLLKIKSRIFFNFLKICTLLILFVIQIPARAFQLSSSIDTFQETSSNFNRSDSVFLDLTKKYNLAVKNEQELIAAGYLQQMGEVLYFSGHYPQALNYLLRANKIFRNLKEEKLLAQNLSALGELYYRSKQSVLAKKQYNEALIHYQNLKLESGKARIYGQLGHLYEKRQLYDSAFYFQRKALLLYQKENLTEEAAKIFENIGSIYEDKENYDSAYVYFNKAYQLNRKHGLEREQVEVLNNLGDVLRKTGRYREGLNMSFQALHLAEKNDNYDHFSGAYNDISKAYNFLNKNDSAYYYLSLSRNYQAEIFSLENNKQLALLQTLFEIEKKDREIENLTQTHKNDILLAISVGLVVLLVLLTGGLVINRQRFKIKNDQKLHAQNKQVYETQSQLMEAELKNKQLQEENLKQQLEIKAKELTSYTLHVIRKNQLLEDINSQLEAMAKDDKRDQKRQIKQLSDQISLSLNDDQHWDEFRGIFEQVHQSFFNRLQQQSDSLTANDLRLLALIKMNHTSADIATLLGISQDSLRVLRHRIRKKLNLPQGDNFSAYIQSI